MTTKPVISVDGRREAAPRSDAMPIVMTAAVALLFSIALVMAFVHSTSGAQGGDRLEMSSP